jgi:uncharacterized protein YecE (DUF72 family)
MRRQYPAGAIVSAVAIVVGTSSWSDPGFVEHWYPKGLAAKDRLDFYAERFDAVELNSSFYAIPSVKTAEGWAWRTPDGFRFDVVAVTFWNDGRQPDVVHIPNAFEVGG